MAADPVAVPDFAAGCVNLASARLGAAALACSDEFFGPLARMLDDRPAEFFPDRYDDNGKWMDGWETRRLRGPGHDWAVIRLAAPGRIAGFDVDTRHFTGNYAPAARIEGWRGAGDPPPDATWTELAAMTPLGASAQHFVRCASDAVISHLRLSIYPDGGVARLRVYGRPVLDAGGTIELSGALNGGRVIGWSNAHYGDIQRTLFPDRGITMGDGWETRRLRQPGHDWMVVRLAGRGTVERIVVDTLHNKGNFPESCSVQAADMGAMGEGLDAAVVAAAMFWPDLAPRTTLTADSLHEIAPLPHAPVTHVRLNIHPDGGLSRFRLFGRLA